MPPVTIDRIRPDFLHNKPHFTNLVTSTGSKTKTAVSSKNCDIVCLVALDIRRCYFLAAQDIINKQTTVYLEKFIDGEAESLEQAIKAAGV